MKAIHLNLLNPTEHRSASPVRAHVLLPVIAGFVMAFVLAWGGFVGVELIIYGSKVSAVRKAIAREAGKTAESDALKAKLGNLQAEADQYAFYLHGQQKRGELLKRLASVIPEGITLSALSIPPPPEQNLKRPLGSKLPPLQGPTQSVERVELRLMGLAKQEQDVFKLMQALEGNAFTGLVSIVKDPAPGDRESPRVLAFRQEAPTVGHRDVFFDIAYDIAAREFVK